MCRSWAFWTEKASLGPKLPLPVCFLEGIRELSKEKAGSSSWPGKRGVLVKEDTQPVCARAKGVRAKSEVGVGGRCAPAPRVWSARWGSPRTTARPAAEEKARKRIREAASELSLKAGSAEEPEEPQSSLAAGFRNVRGAPGAYRGRPMALASPGSGWARRGARGAAARTLSAPAKHAAARRPDSELRSGDLGLRGAGLSARDLRPAVGTGRARTAPPLKRAVKVLGDFTPLGLNPDCRPSP